MDLLDSTAEEPRLKLRRYLITGVALVALAGISIWYVLRFHAEKKTVTEFMNALIAGRTEQAYGIWKPQPSYSYKDFLDDWGPDGYYGPVKSFHIDDAEHLKGGTGVIVVVEVSPFQPFPSDNDKVKSSKNKEVKLWVERKDQSLSFSP